MNGDPPEIISGMVNVELDPQGRLIYLQAIPPEKDESLRRRPFRRWIVLFSFAAEVEPPSYSPQPIWNSLAGGDTRVAWTGNGQAPSVPCASRQPRGAASRCFFP